MADNLTVLNSTGGTFTLRQKDVGAGILANMSLPTDTAGNPMLVLSGSAVTSSMSAAVVALSSLSSPVSVFQKGTYGAGQLTAASVSVTSSGNNTLVTRSVGTIKVYGLYAVPDSPVIAQFCNGSTAAVLSGPMTISSISLPIQTEPYFTTTGTNNFVVNLSTSVQFSGMIYYLDN